MNDPFRYYELVDWVGASVSLALVVAAFLLVWREWRRSNRINDRHASAAEHQAAATDRLAGAIETAAGQHQTTPAGGTPGSDLDDVAAKP